MEAQVYERMAELDSDHWWFVARRDILQNLIERSVRKITLDAVFRQTISERNVHI